MSTFNPIARATLLIPTAHNKHLFILLTDPKQPPDYSCDHNLMVPIGTVYPDRSHDSTCLLYVGDHPFVKHTSYINYQLSRIEMTSTIDQMVQKGVFLPRDIIDGAILARICHGLIQSRHTTLKIKNFYESP